MAINYRHGPPKYSPENSGHDDSLNVGNEFEDFVCVEVAKEGLIIQNIHTKKFQYKTGENLQGFEIKYDGRCTGDNRTVPTNRLSIEIAEKTKAENPNWIPSGIYRDDKSWLYIQGNYNNFWVFSKKLLIQLYKSGRYIIDEMPTIRKFYLPITDADKYCDTKFIFDGQKTLF